MRKRIFFIILLMVLWSITSGCGGPGPGPGPSPTPIPGQEVTYNVGIISFAFHYVPAVASFPTGDLDEGIGSVPYPYWMGETEVTYELWNFVYTWATDAARGAGQYRFQNPGVMGDGVGDTPLHPVSSVNWRDAMVWCNALTECYNALAGKNLACVYQYGGAVVRDSRDSNSAVCDSVTSVGPSDGFRLPSSMEWELAARYKDGANWTPGLYASGATADINNATATGLVAWYKVNSSLSTHPVGEKNPNALGIFDMSGNLGEQCFSVWYFQAGYRANRSGGYLHEAQFQSIGFEVGLLPNYKGNTLGFRLAIGKGSTQSAPTVTPTLRFTPTATPVPTLRPTPTPTSTPGPTPTAGTWTGTKQLGSSANDYVSGVTLDGSGNVYVVGTTFGGLDGNTSAGGGDLFLVKYDSSGAKQWTRQLGSSVTDTAKGVAADSEGNVYIAGSTEGGLDGNLNAGSEDMFLVKYDSSGIKQWARQLGSSSRDEGKAVAVDFSGNVYVAGFTLGGLDGNTNAGSMDIFLVKYDPSGAKQWTKQLGSSVYDRAYGVSVDLSGNVYIAGSTEGGLDGNLNAGYQDMFLVKYDSSGAKQWTRQLGGSDRDEGTSVAVDPSGNVYVAGYTQGGFDGHANAGGFDIILVKYDSSGTKQWTRQLGTSAWDYAYALTVHFSGYLYAAGITNGCFDANTNAGAYDMLLIKYDSSGTKQWTRQLGSSAYDRAFGVKVDNSGDVYVAGETLGAFDGNTTAGGSDMFLAKYNSSGVKQ